MRLKLYKGNVIVIGRESTYSLYDQDLVTFEEGAVAYDHRDAAGFIKLNALRLRTLGPAQEEAGAVAISCSVVSLCVVPANAGTTREAISIPTKMAGISPGHFIQRMLRLTSAARCRAAAAAAMPFRHSEAA